jgi:branched-chain amino acid transport system substrate-binding protein
MKNKKTTIVAILITILLIIGIVNVKSGNDQKIIKIGAVLIMSGDGASLGEATVNGMNLAIKDINNQGGLLGKKLEAVVEDDQGDPAKTVTAFRKLTDAEGIKFIIGPTWTKNGLAIKDLVKDTVVISPTLGVAAFNEASPYIFNTYTHDYILSEKLAEMMIKDGHKNIAILGAQDPWVKDQTITIKNKIEQLGGHAIFINEPLVSSTDVRTDLLKLKNTPGVDAIAITSDGYSITSVYGRQMREIGIKLPVYGVTMDKQTISTCEGSCDGWIYLSGLTPNKDFEERYKKEYGIEIEGGADTAYDSVMLIAQGIKNTNGLDTTKIQEYIHTITEYKGQSGDLKSDGKGGFTKEFALMGIKDNKPYKIK